MIVISVRITLTHNEVVNQILKLKVFKKILFP